MSEVVRLLKNHDISPTQQRVEIAAVLLTRPQHLSADQVMSLVNRDRNVASKATIYNTLALFASKGLIREVIVDPNKIVYDSNTAPHHHFYNAVTGELFDVDTHALEVTRVPTAPANTEVDGIDVIIRVRPKDGH